MIASKRALSDSERSCNGMQLIDNQQLHYCAPMQCNEHMKENRNSIDLLAITSCRSEINLWCNALRVFAWFWSSFIILITLRISKSHPTKFRASCMWCKFWCITDRSVREGWDGTYEEMKKHCITSFADFNWKFSITVYQHADMIFWSIFGLVRRVHVILI